MPVTEDRLLASEPTGWRERQLILSLARGLPLGEDHVRGVDFHMLNAELTRLKLLGLLGPRLIAQTATDPSFVAAVDEISAAGRRDAIYKQMITWRVLRALEQGDVVAMPLKGPFMAERLYGDPGARLSHDVDVLVAVHDLRRAISILERVGYVRPRISDALPLLHHIFEVPDGPPVELHWRIHWYESSYAQAMLARSVLDGDVRHPRPVDELMSLFLVYARDGLAGLRTPLDIAAWWSIHGSEGHAAELRAVLDTHPALTRPVAAAALATERLLGVPVCSLLEPPLLRRRATIAAVSLADWADGASKARTRDVEKVVDGLLTGPTGLGRYTVRAGFPRVPDQPGLQAFRRGLYAVGLSRRGIPLAVRVLTRADAPRRGLRRLEPIARHPPAAQRSR